MRQVLLTVPDEQFAPLMKVVRSLPFNIKIKALTSPKPLPIPKPHTPAQQGLDG